MKFHIIKQHLTGVEIPNQIFENLPYARENDLKVILYVWQVQKIDPIEISIALNITLNSVNSSLLFWSDKGILKLEEEFKSTKVKKAPTLSPSEILSLKATVPEIGILINELQKIFGDTLNQKQSTAFIELFIKENISIDVILTISHYYVINGQNNPTYVQKVILSWVSKFDITTAIKAEEHIALLEKRKDNYIKIAKIFLIDAEDINTSEKVLIDRWFEKYFMSIDMITQAYIRAGSLAHIKYCDGIIKSWFKKGYTKTEDLLQEINNNIVTTGKNIDKENDIILNNLTTVPTFNKGE